MKSSRHLCFLLALITVSGPTGTTLSAQAQNDHDTTTVNVVAMAVHKAPTARSPAALIDDLVQVATHSQRISTSPGEAQNSLPYLRQNPGQTPIQDSPKAKSKVTYQHVIPDVININYRPARAAAQIYMGHGSEDGAARQLDEAKIKDELTVLITAIMLELASGLGEQSSNQTMSDSTIATGMEKLSQLVGPQEANWAFERMAKFSKSAATAPQPVELPATNQQNPGTKTDGPLSLSGDIDIPEKFTWTWDVLGQQTLANKIATKAIARDQTARNLKAMLGVHENPPNPLEKTLSALSMIPEVVATAALVGDQVLEMSNGGTREKRLTDVLSLGLQLDSRAAALDRQSYLAAASINAGRLNGNQTLSAFSLALARQLMGQ
jgi:hypothetical protein